MCVCVCVKGTCVRMTAAAAGTCCHRLETAHASAYRVAHRHPGQARRRSASVSAKRFICPLLSASFTHVMAFEHGAQHNHPPAPSRSPSVTLSFIPSLTHPHATPLPCVWSYQRSLIHRPQRTLTSSAQMAMPSTATLGLLTTVSTFAQSAAQAPV